jgi:hypothetical protein
MAAVTWDNLPAQLRGFANELAKQPETANAGNALLSLNQKFIADWCNGKVTARDIPIPVPRNQGLYPVGCKPIQAFLSFAFALGDCDPGFPDLAVFQVRVESMYAIPSRTIELQDHWRVDTDTFANPRRKRTPGTKPPKEPHPYYHYQRGGRAQDDFTNRPYFVPGPSLPATQNWKALAHSPSPRVPIPPMCPILAVDFSIGEHNGLIWRRLRGTPEYANFVRAAQQRLWGPFFEALNNEKQRRFWLGPILLS